jgi:3-deoxy-7-phosphoheptulonate synthase / chorismate mutase
VSGDEIELLREQLTAVDFDLVEQVNRRLRLVAELKRVKDARGIAFLDPAREEYMLRRLTEENGGPLSDEGLRELYTEVLALTKRELGR